MDSAEYEQRIAFLSQKNRELNNACFQLQTQLSNVEDKVMEVIEKRDHHAKRELNLKEKYETSKDQHARELDDAKSALSHLEDINYEQGIKFHCMEREFRQIQDESERLKGELRTARTDADTYRLRCKDLKHSLAKAKGLADTIDEMIISQTERDHEIDYLKGVLSELATSNENLRREKFDMERQSMDARALEELSHSFNTSYLSNIEEDEDDAEGINQIECPFPSFGNTSLHAEIAASLGPSECSLPLFNRYVDSTQASVQTDGNCESDCYISKVDFSRLLNELRGLVEMTVKHVEGLSLEECPTLMRDHEVGSGVPDLDPAQEEIVRKINEELAEFREQLKKSQELFHTLTNSSQNFSVSQSCPVLAEEDSGKPQLVTCSTQTQTEYFTVMPSDRSGGSISSLYYTSPMPPDGLDDVDSNMFENMSLGDNGSYRLAINLSTVVEETSDQETDTSPTSIQKRMNSEKRHRPKLVKMPNTMEDDHEKLDPDDVKSDNEYASAVSSLPNSGNTSNYGSMERPLHFGGPQVTNGANKDDDTYSTGSGGNTTYGSPISSPSSQAYWTPLEGSSSQDTITIPDGDKTPVNDDFIHDDAFNSDNNSDQSPRPKSSSWGPDVPPVGTPNNLSIGVIPDADLGRMQRNAYDAVCRFCDPDGKVLTPDEWRTLRRDLDAKEIAQFRKQNRQEEGGDTEEGGFPRGSSNMDLDEEAEKYCESFPLLVENLFKSLDNLDKTALPSETELKLLASQFEQLSIVFKTNHINLSSRSESVLKKHEYSQKRMKEIYSSWKDNLRKLREHKSGDIHEILSAMDDSSIELETHSSILASTARSAGMMDSDFRAYKMIEVMVLYVHIMKHLRDNDEEERQLARKLLSDHEIPFPCKKALGQLQNNNNNEKVALEDGLLGEGQETKRCEDGTPRHRLQFLLARKSPDELTHTHKSKEQTLLQDKGPIRNRVLTYLFESYEIWRRELHWPWNWDQTWRGIKQGFSVFIMIVGLVIILGDLIPNVGANGNCETISAKVYANFAKYGELTHNKIPHF